MEGIELKHIIVHKVAKEQGKKKETAEISFGNSVIDSTDKGAILFVNEFYKANTTKRGLQYGTFTENANLKKIIREYDKNISSENFLILSKKIAKSYKEYLVSAATGGYLIIFQYEHKSGKTIFAIAVLKDKESAGISDDLKFISTYTLDMDIMGLATTIMIDRYLDKDSTANHLTFLTGLKGLSDYYKDFIGCTNVKKNIIATKEFMKALENFAKEDKNYNEEKLRPIRDEILKYCDSHKDEAYVKDMLNIAFPEEKDQNDFYIYIDKEQIEVSASFKPNNSVLKSWRKYSIKYDGITLEFSPKKIEENKIDYEIESKRLYINDDNKIFYNEFIKFKTELDVGEID